MAGARKKIVRGKNKTIVAKSEGHGNWFELVVFLMMAGAVYLVGTVLGSTWTGPRGVMIGNSLRGLWGGALLIPILFLIYLCIAWFAKTRIPRPLGQILGTLLLYISTAFILGLFQEAQWPLSWHIAEPGRVGTELAKFSVLNLGIVGTISLAVIFLFLAGWLFGFKRPERKHVPARVPVKPVKETIDEVPLVKPVKISEDKLQVTVRDLPKADSYDLTLPDVESDDISSTPLDGMVVRGEEVVEAGSYLPTDPIANIHDDESSDTKLTVDMAAKMSVDKKTEVKPAPSTVTLFKPAAPKVAEIPLRGLFTISDEQGTADTAKQEVSQKHSEQPQEKVHDDNSSRENIISATEEKKLTASEILENLLASIEEDEKRARAAEMQKEQPAAASPITFMPSRSDVSTPLADEDETAKLIKVDLHPDPTLPPVPQEAKSVVQHGEETLEPVPQPFIPHDEKASESVPTPVGAPVDDGEHDGLDTAVQEAFPDVIVPEDEDESKIAAGVFPPPLDIFGPIPEDDDENSAYDIANEQAAVIVETLQHFGVKATVAHIVIGPSVIQFQLELAPGIKVSKVSGLANDLTMALAVISVRVEAPILGQHYVGIEIPNPKRKAIALRSIMETEEFQNSEHILPLLMGILIDSTPMVSGLENMPHLLVAGTTGSGKSVFVNSCILGMCWRRTPEELKLILIDPKQVEFAIYEGLPHLLARPVSEPKKAVAALSWAVEEMEHRSECFAKAKVRNLTSYNEKVLPKNRFPYIVIVVDEMADLMLSSGREIEGLIVRLAQKARSAGIHLILATQRPSVDVITGLIKANVPARVAFSLPSQTDSRTIIDSGGAEKLLGKGDMLFYSTKYPRPLRLQAAFVTEERTLDFVNYLKNALGEPEYIEFQDPVSNEASAGGDNGGRSGSSIIDDPKIDEAIKVVMDTGIASVSGLQRYLNVGYPRAGRLVTGLEQLGIVGPQQASSSKPREILMDEDSAYETLERARNGGVEEDEQ